MSVTTAQQLEYKRIVVDGVHYYGKHLVLTARGCNEAILDTEAIASFMKELVVQIDMVAYGEPIIARFGGGIEVGISAVQLIETSAITIHTNDAAREMYLDVFSCKGYNEMDAINFLKSIFNPQDLNWQILLRK